jgi:O-antigen ligase
LLIKVPALMDILSVRAATIESGSGRYDLWRLAWRLFQENPLLGVGTNGLKAFTLQEFGIVNVHSTFIEIVVESGVVGGLIYCAFVTSLGLTLIRRRLTIRRFACLAGTMVTVFAVMVSVSATIHPAYLLVLLLAYTWLAHPVRPPAGPTVLPLSG